MAALQLHPFSRLNSAIAIIPELLHRPSALSSLQVNCYLALMLLETHRLRYQP